MISSEVDIFIYNSILMTDEFISYFFIKQVVDARAGPGIKSLTKFKHSKNKKKSKELSEKLEKIAKKKNYLKDGDREQSPAMSDDTGLRL